MCAVNQMQLHYNRLLESIDKVHPELVANVAATLPKAPGVPTASELTAALNDAGVDGFDADEAKQKRKRMSSLSGRLQSRAPGRGISSGPDDSRDVQGAELLTDGEEERDESLYCFCQRPSFGEVRVC